MIEMSKKEKLLNWCRCKKVFSKAEVMKWGNDNYFIRADRQVRDFVTENRMKRIDPTECVLRNLKGHMAYYEVV